MQGSTRLRTTTLVDSDGFPAHVYSRDADRIDAEC
jgi:hypothetical protein